MTNEESTRILRAIKDELILIFDRDRKDALEMAISALKALDQYRRERDIAVEQLKELGYELGEKSRQTTL